MMKLLTNKIRKEFFLIGFLSVAFITSCKREVYTGTVEPQNNQTAKIVVHTQPEGAYIFLNGKNMGIKTPDSLTWLGAGKYTLTLKLDLFPDIKLPVALGYGERSSIDYNYFNDPNNFGSISCKSNPSNADIIMNDSALGLRTPSVLNGLFPGQYKIKLNLAGCRSDSAVVTIAGGKTQNVNIFLDDTTKWVSYKITNSPIPSNYISCLAVDKKNVKWFGTLDKGFAGFDGKNWRTFSKNNSPLIYDFINCIVVDNSNILWIGTSGGLMSFDGTTWMNYTNHLPSTFVTSLIIDNTGVMWIGTQNGLVKYNGSAWTTITTDNSGIAANFVTSLAVDPTNRIWIGSNANGISMFDGKNWKVYNMSNMALGAKVGNSIQDVAVDKDGIVWVAHIQNTITGDLGGLTMFNGTAWSIVTINGLPTETTQSINVDGDNYKWIGTKGGMAKFKYPSNITLFNTVNSKIPASQVQAAAVDAVGDLWIGTFGGGAAKLKKGNF